MTGAADDPRCPECGGPIGQTSTYCMHCSADLTEELEAADADDDGAWDEPGPSPAGDRADGVGVDASTVGGAREAATVGESPDATVGAPGDAGTDGTTDTATGETGDGKILADDGIVDNTLTVLVGIGGGIVVGLVGTVVLLILTESALALVFGFLAWLGATAYLVRRRTVQGAISKGAYGVAAVLLLVPLVALAPGVGVEGGLEARGGLFVVLLVFVALPAGVAALVGFVASRFVPEDAGGSEG